MSELMAGYGEKVITPPLGVDLTGYGFYPDRKAESVLDDLKARVLFLKQKAETAVLISCDLLGFSVEFADSIRRQIASEHGLALPNILLACTHTHTGPACQPLRGVGEIEPSYLAKVPILIAEAVNLAVADQQPATLRCRIETIEPIGCNRRKRNFESIDPALKVAVFERTRQKIYLLSYACHPVILGTIKKISADWPGAVIAAIEKSGNRGIVFQGFCGDINPVTHINRWGQGTSEDLALIGQLLSQRAFKAEKYAEPIDVTSLKMVERRIRLPLKVPTMEEIVREREAGSQGNDAARRFIEEWAREAVTRHETFWRNPWLENIPLQTISIGKLKLIGLPGEVFSEYSLRLQEKTSLLFTLGHANGTVSYFPTKDAYEAVGDYACYGAPKFYCLFPLSQDLENILLRECQEILDGRVERNRQGDFAH